MPSLLAQAPAPLKPTVLNRSLNHRYELPNSTGVSCLLLLKQRFNDDFRCFCSVSESQLTKPPYNHSGGQRRAAAGTASPCPACGGQAAAVSTGWASRCVLHRRVFVEWTSRRGLRGVVFVGQLAQGHWHKEVGTAHLHGAICTEVFAQGVCPAWAQVAQHSPGPPRTPNGAFLTLPAGFPTSNLLPQALWGCSPGHPPASQPRLTGPKGQGGSQGRFLLMSLCRAGQTAGTAAALLKDFPSPRTSRPSWNSRSRPGQPNDFATN